MVEVTYLLPVWNTLREAWDKVTGAKASIWGAFGLLILIMFGLGFVAGFLKVYIPAIASVASFVIQILNYLFSMGLLYIGIRRAQDLPVSFQDMFHTLQPMTALRVIGLYLLQVLIFIPAIVVAMLGVAIAIGTHVIANNAWNITTNPLVAVACISLCVFGFILLVFLAVRMALAAGYILDKNVNPWKAIKLSFIATQHNFWRIVGLMLLQFLFLLISIIPLFIGLIWTTPFMYTCYGMLYKNLSANTSTAAKALPAEKLI